jgi:hypothetical protein
MNTTFSIEETNQIKSSTTPWVELWRKNWSYTNWLMTSVITSIISSEIYYVVLSVYPNFLLNLWFSIGISSISIATMLTYAAILSAGLVSGWLIYSAQLTIRALRTVHKDYQPLIDLWTNYNQNYALIFNQLLNEKGFLKLSTFLKDQSLPEPIKYFLKSENNIEAVQKVISLLKKIWSIEKFDEKIKALTLNILSECSQGENPTEHINNILALCNLLMESNQMSEEMLLKTLEKSSKLNPYLPQLISLTQHKDILYKLIEEPNLMPFYLACQENFKDTPDLVSQNTDNIYLYLRYHLNQNTGYQHFIDSGIAGHHSIKLNSDTFKWLKEHFQDDPRAFVFIFNTLNNHPFIEWIEPIFNFMAKHDKYMDFFNNPAACSALADTFNNVIFLQDERIKAISATFQELKHAEKMGSFCDILLACSGEQEFTGPFIQRIIAENKIEEASAALLKSKSTQPGLNPVTIVNQMGLSHSVESLPRAEGFGLFDSPTTQKKKRHNPIHWLKKHCGSTKKPNGQSAEVDSDNHSSVSITPSFGST